MAIDQLVLKWVVLLPGLLGTITMHIQDFKGTCQRYQQTSIVRWDMMG